MGVVAAADVTYDPGLMRGVVAAFRMLRMTQEIRFGGGAVQSKVADVLVG